MHSGLVSANKLTRDYKQGSSCVMTTSRITVAEILSSRQIQTSQSWCSLTLIITLRFAQVTKSRGSNPARCAGSAVRPMRASRKSGELRALSVLCMASLVMSSSQCTRCTTVDTVGSFSGQTFVPSSGCYYAVPSIPETFALLRGRWVFTCGGSNSWITHSALARQLDPSSYEYLAERYDGTTTVWGEFTDLVAAQAVCPLPLHTVCRRCLDSSNVRGRTSVAGL